MALLGMAPVQAQEPLAAASAHALAPLAPEGRWVTRLELRHNGYDHRYDSDGRRRPLGAPFDELTLDASVFPALALLGGGASLGTTSFSSSVSVEHGELSLGYGLTPNLTAGTIIDFGRTHTQVKLRLSGGNTGWNPAFDPAAPIGLGNFPFAPVGGGAAAPLDTAGLKQILEDPVFGYDYAPLTDAETSGLASILVGALWRVYDQGHSSLVWGAGYRFGLAAANDPDNPFDVPLDDGGNDMVAQVEYFHHWGAMDLRAMAKRTAQLADRVRMRVPPPGEVLASAASEETLKRDLGDYWEYDLELGRSWGDWRTSATWHRWLKAADNYTSPRGQDTAALEANTAIDAKQWRLALSWSGINAWRSGGMPMPLVIRLELQDTYAGRNMVDVRDVFVTLTALF